MKPRKLLSLHGPAHHQQLLMPVEDAVRRRGWDVFRYTVDAEATFQSTMPDDRYLWLPDYADENAAQALYRKNAPYFRELLLQRNGLSLMLPQVLDRIILFCCREWIATRNLLTAEQPTAVLALHELNRWGVDLGYWAHRLKIPYFTLQEGLYYGDPWIYTGHTTYSTTLCWGAATKRILEKAGCPPERVEVIGHPDLDQRVLTPDPRGSDALWERLPEAARGKRLIFVFVAHARILGDFARAFEGMAESDYFLVLRPHQLANLSELENQAKAFDSNGVWSHFGGLDWPYSAHWALMREAEACVLIGCSTTALEWSRTGKPLGQIATPLMARNFAEDGIALSLEGKPLREGLDCLFTEWTDGYKQRQQDFVRDEIANGSAAELLAERIITGSRKKGARP